MTPSPLLGTCQAPHLLLTCQKEVQRRRESPTLQLIALLSFRLPFPILGVASSGDTGEGEDRAGGPHPEMCDTDASLSGNKDGWQLPQHDCWFSGLPETALELVRELGCPGSDWRGLE